MVQTASLLTDDMQVHADASNFASDLSKDEVYKQVLEQAEGLLIDQRNWVCLSPISSLFATTARTFEIIKKSDLQTR